MPNSPKNSKRHSRNQPALVIFAEACDDPAETSEFRDLCDALILEGCPQGLVQLVAGSSHQFVNLADEFQALFQLLLEGFAPKDVRKACGLNKPAFDLVMSNFPRLPESLRAAIAAGTILDSNARALLKLSTADLAQAAQVFAETGNLTSNDVGVIKSRRKATAAAQLPADLFGPRPVEDKLSALRVAVQQALEDYDPGTLHQLIDDEAHERVPVYAPVPLQVAA